MVEQQIINDNEKFFLDEINKFRVDPLSYKQEIIKTGKFLSRIPGKKLQSEELQNIANKVLSTIPNRDKFVVSIGLCKAADEILDNHSADNEFMKIKGKELSRICKKSLKASGLLFNISDTGSKDSLISRLLISDADPDRTYIKALKNPLFKYCGLATRIIDEDEYISVLILSDYILESNEEEPLKNNDEVPETISKEEQLILDNLNKFREDAPSFKQNFQTLSKLFTRIKKKAQSDEAALLASQIDSFPKLSKFNISRGLCKAADEVIFHIRQMKSLGLKEGNFIIDMKEIIELNLHAICDKFVIYNETPLISLDQGDHDLLVARCLISEYDPKREYKKAFISEEFKFAGFATSEIEDETVNVIIFARDIQEKVIPKYNKFLNNLIEDTSIRSDDTHGSKKNLILNFHKEKAKISNKALVYTKETFEVKPPCSSQEKEEDHQYDAVIEEKGKESDLQDDKQNLEENKTSPEQLISDHKNDHQTSIPIVDLKDKDKHYKAVVNQDNELKHAGLDSNINQTSSEKLIKSSDNNLHSGHPEDQVLSNKKESPKHSSSNKEGSDEETKQLIQENKPASTISHDQKIKDDNSSSKLKEAEKISCPKEPAQKKETENLESEKREIKQGSIDQQTLHKNKDYTKQYTKEGTITNSESNQFEKPDQKTSYSHQNDYLEVNDERKKLLNHTHGNDENHAMINQGPDSTPLLVNSQNDEKSENISNKDDSLTEKIFNCIYLIFAAICVLAALKTSLIDNQSISFFQATLLFLGAHGVYVSLSNICAKSNIIVSQLIKLL